MKIWDMFPQHHLMNVRLEKYHFDDLRMDIDTSMSDTKKTLVVCYTFHGHTLPSVGTNMVPLQQSPFVWLRLEFQHLTGEYETLVLQIDVLLLDHVTQV